MCWLWKSIQDNHLFERIDWLQIQCPFVEIQSYPNPFWTELSPCQIWWISLVFSPSIDSFYVCSLCPKRNWIVIYLRTAETYFVWWTDSYSNLNCFFICSSDLSCSSISQVLVWCHHSLLSIFRLSHHLPVQRLRRAPSGFRIVTYTTRWSTFWGFETHTQPDIMEYSIASSSLLISSNSSSEPSSISGPAGRGNLCAHAHMLQVFLHFRKQYLCSHPECTLSPDCTSLSRLFCRFCPRPRCQCSGLPLNLYSWHQNQLALLYIFSFTPSFLSFLPQNALWAFSWSWLENRILWLVRR